MTEILPQPVKQDNLATENSGLDKKKSNKILPNETTKTTKIIKAAERKRKTYIILVLALTLFLFFAGGIFLGFYLTRKKSQPSASPALSLPSPSVKPKPEASQSPSPKPTGLTAKIDSLKEKLKEADLSEKKLLPPLLDFDIRFKVEE